MTLHWTQAQLDALAAKRDKFWRETQSRPIPKPQTHGQDEMRRQLRLAGVRGWVEEHRFHPPRRWRFDFAWPEAAPVALEIEGGTWTNGRHTRGKGFEKDCEKYNQAAADGWLLLRVTTAMVMDGRALDAVTKMPALSIWMPRR